MIDEPNGTQPEQVDIDALRAKPIYQGDEFAGLTRAQADALALKFSQHVGAWREEILSESQKAWEAERDNLFKEGTTTEDIQRVADINNLIERLKRDPVGNRDAISRLTREMLPYLKKRAR